MPSPVTAPPPTSAPSRWSGRRVREKPAWPKRCWSRAGAIGAAGSLERGSTVSDFDPLERKMQHSLNAAVMHLEHAGTRIHLIDTPGRDRLHRPVAAGARSGGDRRGGDQRRQLESRRHRRDGGADDGLRRRAPPRPPAGGQQDRRRRRGAARAAGRHPGHLRPRVPAAEPARCGRRQGGRLLLQPRGPQRFRQCRRGAPRAGRTGGRGRRGLRRPLPERRRHRPRRIARAARTGVARGPPDAGVLCLGAQRSGRGRIARRDRQAAARARAKAIHPSSWRAKAPPPSPRRRSRIRARMYWRMCSRSRSIPSSGAWACSACTRARSRKTACSTSATAANRSRSATCSCCRASEHVEVQRAVPGDIVGGGQGRRDPLRRRAARRRRRRPHPPQAACPSRFRCTAWRSSPSAAATSSACGKS